MDDERNFALSLTTVGRKAVEGHRTPRRFARHGAAGSPSGLAVRQSSGALRWDAGLIPSSGSSCRAATTPPASSGRPVRCEIDDARGIPCAAAHGATGRSATRSTSARGSRQVPPRAAGDSANLWIATIPWRCRNLEENEKRAPASRPAPLSYPSSDSVRSKAQFDSLLCDDDCHRRVKHEAEFGIAAEDIAIRRTEQVSAFAERVNSNR